MTRKKFFSQDVLLHFLSQLTDKMTTEEQSELLNACSVRNYAVGDIISGEGDIASHLFCMIDGVAKISIRGDVGWQTVRLVKEGEFFGYRAFFASQNHRATYFAMTDTYVCLIPMEIMSHFMAENSFIKDFFLQRLARNLLQSDYRFVCLIQKHLRGRLAATLMSIAEYFGYEGDGQTLAFSMSRAELANLANMTTSNAIRTLSAFKNEGLLKLDHKKIKLLDIKELTYISLHD